MDDQPPVNDSVPERPLPPEQLPGAQQPVPSQFTDLPRPARRGDGGVAVPFDPMGYQVFSTLTEVIQKKAAAEDVLTKGQIDAARRKATFVPKFPTIESMYAHHPELQRVGRLRIERVQPQWYDDQFGQKNRVSGTLDFNHACIGSEEFARKFGGFRYRVFGLLEQENRENVGGPPQPVEIAVAEFEVPVPPNLENLPIAEGHGGGEFPSPIPMFGQTMFGTPYGRRQGMLPNYPFFQQPQMSPQGVPVEPVLNFASRVMEQRQPATPPMSDAMWHVFGEQSKNATQTMRETMDAQQRMMLQHNEQLQRQVEQERSRALDMANRPTDMVQMVESVAKLTSAQKGGMDSDSMRQLRDEHERQIRHQQDLHERAITRTTEDHERALKTQRDDLERIASRERDATEMKVRISDERIKELEQRLEYRERQLMDDAERRERQLKDEFARALDSRDKDHMHRMGEMKDVYQREISTTKEMHDRELRMRETIVNSTSTTTDKAHAIEMRSLQTDLAKLTGELAEKRRMVEEHLAEKNKPLLQQVQELQSTTEALQEIAGGGKDDDSNDGDKKWYDSELVKAIAPIVVAKATELFPKMAEAAREQNAAHQNPQMQGQPMPHGLPPRQQPRQILPPRRKNRVMFADTEGTPLRDFDNLPARGVAGDMGQKRSGPRPFEIEAPGVEAGPAEMPPAPLPRQQPRAVQPQRMPGGQVGYPANPAANAAAVLTEEGAAQAPTQGAASSLTNAPAAAAGGDEWMSFSWMPMERNDAVNFIQQLESAFNLKIQPQALVQGFCSNYPMETIAQIPQSIPIARLIETVRTSPATARMGIASGGGRRYLSDVWAEMVKRLEDWKAQGAPKGPTPATEVPPVSQVAPSEPDESAQGGNE